MSDPGASPDWSKVGGSCLTLKELTLCVAAVFYFNLLHSINLETDTKTWCSD